ncbi:diguanylate cyclase with PAS/PAC and GAF sensors [Dyella jiangningensis]|uniref:sensor domain-containing protein n=2 Tax=Gammaproteobacteria TaxID=1236 RepID=UPI00087FFB7B|nr:diguanylate cyclase [Dyella sp. AtDHG13]PXV53268.1 PAS domain S-box-containing protein/diguanylate cyclase (GGDEF)-like protein [Dyella sp. AtDHG13]SDL36266.1 diguanylate cyclase with PAS/PAC and GAF sensors [Dyella jiangningensis]
MEPVALSKIMDLLWDAICVVDAEGRYVFVSASYERIFGYRPEEVIGRRMIELVHPDDREATLEVAAAIMAGHPQSHFQNRYIRKDGAVVHIMWSARWSEADRVRIAVARDITALKRAESMTSALHAISEAAHTADNLPALYEEIHRIIGTLLPANNFFVALYDPQHAELSFPYFVDERDHTPPSLSLDSGTLTAQLIRSGQALLVTPNAPSDPSLPIIGTDARHWLGVPLCSQGATVGALVVQSYSDATRYTDSDKELLQFVSTQVAAAIERKQAEERLHHIARHDPLTDLANRDLFHQQFEAALENVSRFGGNLALLYIDLDKFKQVNDRFGHHTGDLLLCEVAQRIRGHLREGDVVGRMGGDEFVVLLCRLQSIADSISVAEKLRAAIHAPFRLADRTLRASTSVGVATYPLHGQSTRELMRAADAAMYRVKKDGGNRVNVADAQDGKI